MIIEQIYFWIEEDELRHMTSEMMYLSVSQLVLILASIQCKT